MIWLPDHLQVDSDLCINFSVKLEPRGKGRPRAGINRKTGKLNARTDDKTRAWELDFIAITKMAVLRNADRIKDMAGKPLFVGLSLFYRKPKKAEWFCTKAIDNDNAEKLVWDSMQGIFFHNDNRIVANATYKDWTSGDPGLHVYICALKRKPT